MNEPWKFIRTQIIITLVLIGIAIYDLSIGWWLLAIVFGVLAMVNALLIIRIFRYYQR